MPPSWESPEVTLAPPVLGGDAERAARCGLRVAATVDPTSWQLSRTPLGMRLRSPAAMGNSSLELSLVQGALARRLRSTRADEPLPRAIGLTRRQAAPSVVDATAGLCRDALVLAHLGCRVTAIERVGALAFLVEGAIGDTPLADRLRLVVADSTAWLRALPPDASPDVVYLDPMFDDTGSAQVKKDMQLCRALAGPPGDVDALFAAARARANARVVVKRHRDAAPVAEDVSFAVAGERVRFDVYVTRR